MPGNLLKTIGFSTVASLIFSSCSSTPKHSNTLIFGTNTIVALDVSQSPTGNIGVTIGYKRQEAVWMPLLANSADSKGAEIPATCQSDDCKSFSGTTGDDGQLNGPNAHDTYSVLATLSGQATSSASTADTGVQSGGAIAQYFATGFAARLLAERGGAALVNTGVSAGEQKAAAQQHSEVAGKIDRIIFSITGKDGKVDMAKRDSLFNAAKFPNPSVKNYLLQAKTADELRNLLVKVPVVGVEPLFDALT